MTDRRTGEQTNGQTGEWPNEPTDIRMGWYTVRFDYAPGHKPAVVDLAILAEVLPHGAGIDGDWHVQVRRNGDVCVSGEYHAMNDGGYYDGWRNFRFTLARATRNEYVALCGPCAGKYQVTHVKGKVYFKAFMGGGDASDYLYDTCYWALGSLGTPSMDRGITMESESAAKNYVESADDRTAEVTP